MNQSEFLGGTGRQKHSSDPVLLFGNKLFMLQRFLAWLCGSLRFLHQNNPNNWTAPANCSAVLSQRLHRGLHPAREPLRFARTSCYQWREIPGTVSTHLSTFSPPPRECGVQECEGPSRYSRCVSVQKTAAKSSKNYLVIYLAYCWSALHRRVTQYLWTWIANVVKKKKKRRKKNQLQ